MIKIEKIDDRTFKVTVEGRTTTTHRVTVEPSYHEELTGGRVSQETLLKKSFEFLIERESHTSILRSFDLPVIGQYFPVYESTIMKMFE